MGVAPVPFRHFTVWVFQGAVNRKVWEAGVGAEQPAADVITPAVFQNGVFFFFLQFLVFPF